MGKSQWVLMTKGILEQTRGEERNNLLIHAQSEMGHQAPTSMEAIVGIIMIAVLLPLTDVSAFL